MSNIDLSKIKILLLYDYFKNQMNAFDQNGTVSISELITYLKEKTGYEFERKSIYSDINKINDFINKTGRVVGGDSWIVSEGKKYRRNQLADEISLDEARLIVDAISTTYFVDTVLCDKIIKMFPTYFDADYKRRALVSHYEKIDRKKLSWLNNIRSGIDSRSALKIIYGYKLGNELTEKTEKIVSPMALDWENNCYYLIAVDNSDAADLERDRSLSKALRRYRVDRMAQVQYAQKGKYIDYKSEKIREQELKKFIDNSLSAFSSNEAIVVRLTITGRTRKDALKAYGAFASRIRNEIRIDDDTKLDSGILKISVETGKAPTLYTDLFELSTFEGVSIKIDNDEVCREYAEYIKKAAMAAKLESL